jgi:hypothetical protein
MNKLILTILCLSSVVLAGCSTQQEMYNEAKRWCNMSWYSVYTHPDFYEWRYICTTKENIREYKFRGCSNDCDNAIDDYRDVSNIQDLTISCLKLCLWE